MCHYVQKHLDRGVRGTLCIPSTPSFPSIGHTLTDFRHILVAGSKNRGNFWRSNGAQIATPGVSAPTRVDINSWEAHSMRNTTFKHRLASCCVPQWSEKSGSWSSWHSLHPLGPLLPVHRTHIDGYASHFGGRIQKSRKPLDVECGPKSQPPEFRPLREWI